MTTSKGSIERKPRTVAQRTTEGSRTGAIARGQAPRGRGGRPKGSKNKPKGLIPLPVAEDLINSLQPMLPPDQIRYLKTVLKDGGPLDTRKELDTLIALLNRSLWPALVSEAVPYTDKDLALAAIDHPEGQENEDDDQPQSTEQSGRPPTTLLRRDVTDRLKVITSLLNLRNSLDKSEKDKDDEGQPVLKLFAERGVETRIALLLTTQKDTPQIAAETIDSVAVEVK